MRCGEDIWTEHLTDAQLRMVIQSGFDSYDGQGYGVELRGSGAWATARSLTRLGLGWIEGGEPQGSSLPGLFFNNREGVRICREFEEEAACEDCDGDGRIWNNADPTSGQWIECDCALARIEAGTDETAKLAQPEGREPDKLQTQSPSTPDNKDKQDG